MGQLPREQLASQNDIFSGGSGSRACFVTLGAKTQCRLLLSRSETTGLDKSRGPMPTA